MGEDPDVPRGDNIFTLGNGERGDQWRRENKQVNLPHAGIPRRHKLLERERREKYSVSKRAKSCWHLWISHEALFLFFFFFFFPCQGLCKCAVIIPVEESGQTAEQTLERWAINSPRTPETWGPVKLSSWQVCRRGLLKRSKCLILNDGGNPIQRWT